MISSCCLPLFALLPKLQKAHDLPTKSLGLITATSVIIRQKSRATREPFWRTRITTASATRTRLVISQGIGTALILSAEC